MCKQVRQCNIIDDVEIKTEKVSEKVCNKVPRPRQVCSTVSIPSPPTVRTHNLSICVVKQYGRADGKCMSGG